MSCHGTSASVWTAHPPSISLHAFIRSTSAIDSHIASPCFKHDHGTRYLYKKYQNIFHGIKDICDLDFSIFLHPHYRLLPNIYIGLQTNCSQCLYCGRLSYAAMSLHLISSVETIPSPEKTICLHTCLPYENKVPSNRIIMIVLLSLTYSSLPGT